MWTSPGCRPFAFLPAEKFRDHCQLAPSELQDWLHEHAAIPARVHYAHPWRAKVRPRFASGLVHRPSDAQPPHHDASGGAFCTSQRAGVARRRPSTSGGARCNPMSGGRPINASTHG